MCHVNTHECYPTYMYLHLVPQQLTKMTLKTELNVSSSFSSKFTSTEGAANSSTMSVLDFDWLLDDSEAAAFFDISISLTILMLSIVSLGRLKVA